MVSFVVSKKKIKGTIDYFEYDSDGFKYYPKFKSIISDNGVDIRYKYLIDILLFEFDKDFDKMTKSIYKYVTSEDDDDDTVSMLLNEVARLKSIVELEYKKHVTLEKYKEYLNKLYYLDAELKRKKAILRYNEELDYEMNRGRSL